ncbi:MAG TPA: galactose oxidase early set domain-containing protein, partial [Gemmatimonadales bacterium]|nr:galactose oxidase early set domain-containing protein [Gemmatimonadales bacterium]
ISAAPSPISYNSTFTVTTSQAAGISKVSLIRLPSVTHAFDMNQRYQRLSFTRGSGVLTVTAPSSRNVTPPGHYMLFILNSNGVPSKAKIVRIR